VVVSIVEVVVSGNEADVVTSPTTSVVTEGLVTTVLVVTVNDVVVSADERYKLS